MNVKIESRPTNVNGEDCEDGVLNTDQVEGQKVYVSCVTLYLIRFVPWQIPSKIISDNGTNSGSQSQGYVAQLRSRMGLSQSRGVFIGCPTARDDETRECTPD